MFILVIDVDIKKINYKIIRSLVVIVLFHFGYLFQYLPIYLFKIDTNLLNSSNLLIVLLSCFAEAVLFFIFLVIYRKDLFSDLKKFSKNWLKKLDSGLICWLTGLFIMGVCNIILAYVLKSGGANNENIVQSFLKEFPILMGIDICILAPFVEEMVFRKSIIDVFKNRYIGVFISFLFFGLAHVYSTAETLVDWLYIIPYGALGGAFALADYNTDNIYTSIFYHMLHNSIMFIISILV